MSNIVGTHPVGIKPLGFEQITVDNTEGGKALTVPPNAVRALVGVEAQPLRWRDDGTAPTATVGFNVKADVNFELFGSQSLKAFRAIRTGGTSATLNVVYYG
jgi:hypothetical protein